MRSGAPKVSWSLATVPRQVITEARQEYARLLSELPDFKRDSASWQRLPVPTRVAVCGHCAKGSDWGFPGFVGSYGLSDSSR